jgi:thioredoxin reductase
MQKIEKVAIIGAGPAGIATAIQLKRYEIAPIIFEKARIGGLLLNANLVENYPGFPEGISGITLVKTKGH